MWKSFKSKALTVRQLSFSDWLALAEAWWALLGFSLALRWVSLERMGKIFRLNYKDRGNPSIVLAFAQRKQKLVSIASRLHLLSMTCLVRAYTLHWMLGLDGIPSQLCIGVNKTQGIIHAHAWVQVMGNAIGETKDIDEKFMVLQPIQSMKAAGQ